MALTPSAVEQHSAPSENVGQALARRRPFFLRLPLYFYHTWRDYWWRGLKVASRARWPFWVPVGTAVYWQLRSLLRSLAQLELLRLPSLPQEGARDWLLAARISVEALGRFASALTFGDYPCLVVVCLFSVSVWLRLLKKDRPENRSLAAVGALAPAALVLQHFLGKAQESWYVLLIQPWLAAGNIMDAETGSRLKRALLELGVWSHFLWPVLLAVVVGWLGSLYLCGCRARR